MKTALLSTLISTALILLPGCDPSSNPAPLQHEAQHKRGLAENPRRILLGMRPIDPSWICFRCVGNRDEWLSDPAHDIAAVKRVDRDAEGLPLVEVDTYLSGKKYTNTEGNVSDEELRVQCDWRTGVITLTYLGGDATVQKSIAQLPPFTPQTRITCTDLVTSITQKWKIIR